VSALAAIDGIHVQAGGDVAEGGAVIGSSVMRVTAGDADVTVLDADDDKATATASSLERAGAATLTISATDASAAAAKILAALGREGND
jgi:hypothetical protein